MKITQKILHIIFIIFITLCSLFGLLILLLWDFLTPINNFFVYRTGGGQWQDRIYEHQIEPKSKIALIVIDEKTINTYQSDHDVKMLTIPKSIYGNLIDELENIGVKGIGFDIIFQNPDEQEQAFADTIQNSTNTVIATSISSQTFEEMIENSNIEGKEKFSDTLDATEVASIIKESDASDLDPCLRSGYERICPLTPREVYKNVRWGIIEIIKKENTDKKLIGYDISKIDTQEWKVHWTWSKIDDMYVFTLALALVQDEKIESVQRLKDKVKDRSGAKIFENKDPYSLLNQYMWPPNSYTKISLVDFLKEPKKYADTLEDAYVFVGESGTIIHDEVTSPVNNTLMSGMEMHAHFLDAILQDKILTRPNDILTFISWVILSIVFVLIYYFVPNILSPCIFVIANLAVIWMARYLYDQARILVDVLPLLLSVSLLSYPITMIYRFFVVDHQKRKILSSFGRYVSPKVVGLIDQNRIEAELGGETRELSILFSDIAGFTALSEQLETRELFQLMVSYLSYMTEILLEEGGTLDKYIGDAVMGFFGAPVRQQDHAIRACSTAIRMRKRLENFNTQTIVRGINPLDFRIGIATGEVMIGNIGSKRRFNYTVLGDRVNLASRLEAIGKEYKVHTVIAHNTADALDSRFFVRELDTIAVKGKSQSVRIFELVDFAENLQDTSFYDTYEKALLLYRAGKYQEARNIWNSQAQIDPPSQVMAVRCTRIINKQVDIENAIYRMEHK